MKASGGPQKLRFTIQSVSGEDSDFPVRELLFHSPQTRGWVSPRFCKYPQDIVLRLEAPSKIQQIQILSHEFKIATKIELYSGLAAQGEDHMAAMKRLGYLSFDCNDRSNHQARELKSVHLTTSALLVRLVIHRCWVNRLNIYNQVGIIALNLIGEPIAAVPAGPLGFLEHGGPTRDVTYYNQAAAETADLNLDLHVDSITAQKIRELARTKDAAVAREDYDEAKRIKESIDRLKVMGQKIAQLEQRKRAAVEREDYDTAKLIKADMDKLRNGGDLAAIAVGGPPRDPDQIIHRHQKPPSSSGGGAARVSGGGAPGSRGGGGSVAPTPVGTRPVPYDDQPLRPAAGALNAETPNGEHSGQFGNPEESSSYINNTKSSAYDDRPAQGRGKYTPSAEEREAARPPQAAGGDTTGAPPGWPGDLPGPEPLAGNASKDAEPLEELSCEYVAKAMFSKNWQLRDAALTYLTGQVQKGQYSDRRDAFRTLIRTVQRGLNDKVANVFLNSLALFATLVETLGAAAGGRDMGLTAEIVLPALLEKLGDTNARLREASREAILNLAGLPDGGLRSTTHVLLKPFKNQSAWRPVLGVLQILQDLVPVLGISKTGDGFELGELMEFVNKAFTSANVEVRAAAISVTREAFDIVGQAVRKFLAKDLSAKMKEQIDAALEGAAEPKSPHPVVRALPNGNQNNGNGNNSKSAKAAKAAPPPPRSSGGSRPGSSAPQAAADDPAPYEDELRLRESSMGKMHPDVAESCSNLAILYNQKGEYDKALPLYERALKIYEKQYGPDHPEVAHTLTDLAVLHLEQGRDGVGRPLLERALRIQEKALGPDHPDVLAIKDVLNSE